MTVRMAWPEKTAIAAALFIGLLGFSLWILLAVGARSILNVRFNMYAISWSFAVERTAVLPLWLGLRLIHLALAAVSRAFLPLTHIAKIAKLELLKSIVSPRTAIHGQ